MKIILIYLLIYFITLLVAQIIWRRMISSLISKLEGIRREAEFA